MDTLVDYLTDTVKRYEFMAHPALLERFVLGYGHPGIAQKRPKGYRKRADKMCFKNATEHVLFREPDLTYVEGFACNPMHGLLIHHAWVEDAERRVIDLTWRTPETCMYFGVSFSSEQLRRNVLRFRRYGLLDTGFGLNTDLIFEMSPELEYVMQKITFGPNQLKELQRRLNGAE